MYSGYENWRTRGLDELEKKALALLYTAWRFGKPIDRQRAIFQLSRGGVDVDAAANALAALVNPDPAPRLLRVGDDRLTPTIAAAIHLRDQADAADDLAHIERIATYLHQHYDPDVRAHAVTDVATALALDERRVRQAMELWKGASEDRIGVEPDALFWTTHDRFLASAIGRPPAALATARDRREPSLPIQATTGQVRWTGVGPFVRQTTLQLGAMTFVVGANAAGKTTALAVLAALRDVTSRGLAGVHPLVPRLPADTDEVALAVDAQLRRPLAVDDVPTSVRWELTVGRVGQLHARAERATVAGRELAAFERGVGRWQGPAGDLVQHTMRPSELALHAATDLTNQWPLIALRQQLARWWIELVPAVHAPTTEHDPRWRHFRRDPQALRSLLDVARRVAGIRDLVVDRDGVVIDDGRHRGPIEVMPRGVVRVVELLAVLFAPDPPPLVAIDEIENHLHGDLALRLLEVMRSVSHRTQIVVTTHSARVLRAAQPDELQLCHRTPQGSAIAPLRAYPHLMRLAASGDLGELIEGGHFVETP